MVSYLSNTSVAAAAVFPNSAGLNSMLGDIWDDMGDIWEDMGE